MPAHSGTQRAMCFSKMRYTQLFHCNKYTFKCGIRPQSMDKYGKVIPRTFHTPITMTMENAKECAMRLPLLAQHTDSEHININCNNFVRRMRPTSLSRPILSSEPIQAPTLRILNVSIFPSFETILFFPGNNYCQFRIRHADAGWRNEDLNEIRKSALKRSLQRIRWYALVVDW